MLITMEDVTEISIAKTMDDTLPMYSFSMFDLISRCPVRGLTVYVANKTAVSSEVRAMALDAGAAAHETFAAARLWQIREVQGHHDIADFHGVRLFGEERYNDAIIAGKSSGTDTRNAMLRFCLEPFYSSGFYDDPGDKRRTFSNIEEALIAYLDCVDMRRNVWIEDVSNPTSAVGIELPLDTTITYYHGTDARARIRYIGMADGVMVDRDGALRLEDNKTTSRLGEEWAMQWWTSHQITGYLISLAASYGLNVHKATICGMAIPLPRSYDAGGIMNEPVTRTQQQNHDFLAWLLHILQLIEVYGSDPINAPRFTTSCYDYFRICSMLPLCSADQSDRAEMYEELETRKPTPTELMLKGV